MGTEVGPGSGAAGRARGWRGARANGAAGPETGRVPGRVNGAAGLEIGTEGPVSAVAAPGIGTEGPEGGRERARGTAGRASGAAGLGNGTETEENGADLRGEGGRGHRKSPRQVGSVRPVRVGRHGGGAGGYGMERWPQQGRPGLAVPRSGARSRDADRMGAPRTDAHGTDEALHQPHREGSQRPLFLTAPSAQAAPLLTTVEALLLQQRTQDLALQGAEVAQAAQLLRQLRVGQRQVHPVSRTELSHRTMHGPAGTTTKLPPNLDFCTPKGKAVATRCCPRRREKQQHGCGASQRPCQSHQIFLKLGVAVKKQILCGDVKGEPISCGTRGAVRLGEPSKVT